MPSSTPIHDVALEPQWYYSSCWAASLTMAARMLTPDRKELNQCYFIHKKQNERGKCGCVKRGVDPLTGQIIEKKIYLTKKHACGIYQHNIQTADPKDIEKLAREITQNTYRTSSVIPLQLLLQKTSENKPLLFYYRFADPFNDSDGGYHVCLISAIESLDRHNGATGFLLAVKDPWPTCWGTDYYMSYESYLVQPLAVNICLWDQTDARAPARSTDMPPPDEFGHGLYDTPEKTAESIRATLQYMLENGKNPRLLKKIGLLVEDKADKKIFLSAVSYEVNDVGSTGIVIYKDEGQIGILTLDNTKEFNKRIYFLIQDNEIKTALIVCQSIDESTYNGKWLLHILENGARYRAAIQAGAGKSENLALFRITGEINGEMLLEPKTTGMAADKQNDRVDYRVVSRIRFGD